MTASKPSGCLLLMDDVHLPGGAGGSSYASDRDSDDSDSDYSADEASHPAHSAAFHALAHCTGADSCREAEQDHADIAAH